MYKTKAQFKAKQAGIDLNEVKGNMQPGRGSGQAARPQDLIVSFFLLSSLGAGFCRDVVHAVE